MSLARSKQAKARTKKLQIGQTVPQVQDLLGDPHEKIFGANAETQEEQLWIYFLNGQSLHLSFHHFQLFKIEEF